MPPKPPFSNYEEAQNDEIEVLKAIYADNFTAIESKSAWSKAADKSFRLRLSSYTNEDTCITLMITLTATYPKTFPIIKLVETNQASQDAVKRIESILGTKPRQLLGEVMIHDLSTSIQDVLEDCATAVAEKEARKAKVPSLERERSVQEATALKAEEEHKQAILQRERETKAERQAAEERRLQSELEKRTRERAKRRSELAIHETNTAESIVRVDFDQVIHYQDEAGNTETFSSVIITPQLTKNDTGSTFTATPLTAQVSSSVFVLRRIVSDQKEDKALVLDAETLLLKFKSLRHINLLNLLDFQIEQRMEGWQLDLLSERASQGSLTDILSIADTLGTGKVRRFGLEVLQALDFLHRNDVVHSSLTTDSVYLHLTIDGNTVVKLGNVGLNERLHEQRTKSRPAKWSSPESVTALQTRKTDIWDFGVLIAKLLVGLHVVEKYSNPGTFVRTEHLSDPFEDLMDDIFQTQAAKRPNAFDLIRYEFFRSDEPALLLAQQQSSKGTPSTPTSKLRKGSSAAPELAVANPSSRYTSEWDELGRLGKGGFGEVVKARNRLDGRVCAIKKITHKTPAELNHVLSEIHLLAQLNHAYIVRYYGAWPEDEAETEDTTSSTGLTSSSDLQAFDANASPSFEPSTRGLDFISSSGYPKVEFGYDDEDQDGSEEAVEESSEERNITDLRHTRSRTLSRPAVKATLYIQMEYCERLTLRDLIRKDLSSKADEIWRLLRQILEGLVHIHSHGIIHRDLKPENIFIDAIGDPRIGDFGLATSGHVVRPGEEHDSSAISGDMTSNVGTTLYVAPEVQAKDSSAYTNKIDMYSLGIILFEMIYPLPTSMERLHTLMGIRQKDHILPTPSSPSDDSARQYEIVDSLIVHQPSRRPAAAELLHTVPIQIRDESVRQTLEALADETSPYHQKIISALFAQPSKGDLAAQMWDATDREAQQSLSSSFALMQGMVKDTMTECFRRHGSIEMNRQGLMPRSAFYEGKSVYHVLDASGTVVQLPYDLTLPFARMIAKQGKPPERSYTFGVVFRDALNNGAPRTAREADFDIITHEVKDLALHEAEVIKMMDELLGSFPSLASAPMCFHISHSDLLESILAVCRIAEIQRPAVKEVLGRLNIQSMTWPKIRAELRAPTIGIPATSLNDLAQFDFRDSPENVLKKLQSLFAGTPHLAQLHNVFVQISGVVEYCQRFCVRRKIYVNPLSSFNDKFYRGGIIFQCIFDNKKRDVLAAGGRYDSLIESQRVSAATTPKVHAVGISIAWDRIVTSMVRLSGLDSSTNHFLRKGEDMPSSQWPIRRCDVLIASLDTATLRSTGIWTVADLWAHGISAEIAGNCVSQDDLLSRYKEDRHSWIVMIRQEGFGSAKSDLRVKNMHKQEDTDVQSSELVTFLRAEIRERDQQEGSLDRTQHRRQDTQDAPMDKADVHVLVSGHKTKKSNKMRLIENARAAAQNLIESFEGAPIVAIETRDDILEKLRDTRLSDAESWRKLIQEVPLTERQYAKEIQEEIESLKVEYGERCRNCFVYNFRTAGCILYDMKL